MFPAERNRVLAKSPLRVPCLNRRALHSAWETRTSGTAFLASRSKSAGCHHDQMAWWHRHYDLPGATKLPVLDVPFTPKE
ncbi:hypothetical protein D7V80_17260 [Corallococcus sp. CA054B]|nr:hypothetical protein D7V80_17260 [Corallococcus sp. CA054B]